MKKITTLASSVILCIAAGSASAALLDVTGVLTATITGAGTGTQTGTGVGTYDTETNVLTMQTSYFVSNSGILSGSMDQTGETIIDFDTLTGSNEVLTCSRVSGIINLCNFVPGGPQTLQSVTGDYLNFIAVSEFSGATTTQTWEITAEEVPVPAAAWLFGSALIGLTGIGRRRAAK